MWAWIAWIVLALLLVLGLAYVCLIRKLLNTPGSFQASLQLPSGKWRSGIAVFTHDSIDWHNTRIPFLGANRVWKRDDLDYSSEPVDSNGIQVIQLKSFGKTERLASHWQAIAAIVSWMDSAAPQEEPTF